MAPEAASEASGHDAEDVKRPGFADLFLSKLKAGYRMRSKVFNLPDFYEKIISMLNEGRDMQRCLCVSRVAWRTRANFKMHIFLFPECVARVPVSFGGLGVRLCLRKVVSVFATVCVTAVRLSTMASASGVVLKACEVDPLSP